MSQPQRKADPEKFRDQFYQQRVARWKRVRLDEIKQGLATIAQVEKRIPYMTPAAAEGTRQAVEQLRKKAP